MEFMHQFIRLQWTIVAVIVAALGSASARLIDASPVTRDAAQNLQLAINVSHHGVMSLDEAPPYQRSMYREPFPVAVSAVVITIVDRSLGKADATEYFSGERAKLVKYQNILWLISLWSAVFVATRWFTGSFFAAAFAGIVAVNPYLGSTTSDGVNYLYTELPAAVLLTFGSLALSAAASKERPWLFGAAGLCFGLLALTKSAAVYVFGGLAFVLLIGYARAVTRPDRKRRMLNVALMMAMFAIVVGPWIGRNALAFGRPQISERGGLAIYTRALMDQMTPSEYRGSFYAWARPAWRAYIGPFLGFTEEDLKRGGRLQRFNEDAGTTVDESGIAAEAAGRPENAISFYRKARAERTRIETDFGAHGDPHPDVAADLVMENEGFQVVEGELGHNLEMTIPLLWRGAPLIFPVLLLVFGYSLWAKRYTLSLLILPSLAMLSFYALATNFVPRYSALFHPTAVAAIVILIYALWQLRVRKGRTEERPGLPAEDSIPSVPRGD
jgi:4-amino-4-deoxy-L-arabinose transferase-like glycosyltransferase